MDTGPLLNARTMPVGEDDTAETMFPKLSALGAEALTEPFGMLRRGTLAGTPQDGAMATYAPMLKKEHGRIDWEKPAREVRDLVRGMTPWPSACCDHAGRGGGRPGGEGTARGGPGEQILATLVASACRIL